MVSIKQNEGIEEQITIVVCLDPINQTDDCKNGKRVVRECKYVQCYKDHKIKTIVLRMCNVFISKLKQCDVFILTSY
jgi:hypothetical protein